MTRKPWDKGGTTRHQQGYGTAWNKLRSVILQRDNYLCQACLKGGRVVEGNHVDHITPKAKGGTDDPDNLQVLCKSCHQRKTIKEKGHRVRPTFGIDGWPVEE